MASPTDQHIRYPSLKNPPSAPPSDDPQSRLHYPDSVSVESVTDELSHAQISPKEGSEEVLVKIPDAIAHLIDRQASVHLGSGDFSLVRLTQGGNGLAVFARVGTELQWPLAKDQASVKLDQYHYFFSLTVPPEIEEECRSSPEERNQPAEASSLPSPQGESTLHYGLTFSPASDAASLQKLDEVLTQYSYFTAPTVAQADGQAEAPSVIVADAGNGDVLDKEGLRASSERVAKALSPDTKDLPTEEGSAEYWTLMAPNVEDYSSGIAKAIATGAGHIIRGIFWCSEATIAQLEKGNLFMKGRLKPKDSPTKISPAAMKNLRRVKRISVMSEQVANSILTGVINAAAFITRPLVTSRAGQKLLGLLPGQIALASLEGFGKIFDALEAAGKSVLTTTSVATTGLVTQRYGEEAGQFTQEGFNTAGGFLTTAWTVSKLRKVFYPSTFVKSAAKVAGEERKANNASTNGGESSQLKES